MIYSLNEIDSQCKKAARGAGFEWGHAEDIGKTIRWLAAFDLPGTGLFVAYLKAYDHDRSSFCQPDLRDPAHIRPVGAGFLCPLLTGAAMCDAATLEIKSCVYFEKLGYPLLLMPMLAQYADSISQTLICEFDSSRLRYSNGRLEYNDGADLNCALAERLKLSMDDSTCDGKTAAVVGQQTASQDWDVLNFYALKTCVPATEASRRGAGPAE